MSTTQQQAQQLLREGQVLEARLAYERLLTTHPNDPETLQALGVLNAQLEAFPEALSYLEQALVADPKNPRIHNNIANVHKKMRQMPLALQYYQSAVA